MKKNGVSFLQNPLSFCVVNRSFFLSFMESQMVIFGSEQKKTGAKIVVMATSQYVSSCVFLNAQYWCQVSIIFIQSFL